MQLNPAARVRTSNKTNELAEESLGGLDLASILQKRSPVCHRDSSKENALPRTATSKLQQHNTGEITAAINEAKSAALKLAEEEGWADAATVAALKQQLVEKDARIAELEAALGGGGYEKFTSRASTFAAYAASAATGEAAVERQESLDAALENAEACVASPPAAAAPPAAGGDVGTETAKETSPPRGKEYKPLDTPPDKDPVRFWAAAPSLVRAPSSPSR